MSTATVGTTAETRLLPLRRRADLICNEQQIGGTRFWHVKDPVSQRYFQLRVEEYAVLQMLDGTASLRDIRRQFEQQFAPQRLSLAQVQSFLGMLHSSGLIISDSPGQANHLLERSLKEQRRRRFGAWSNVLAIRFRGFDPHRVLTALESETRFLFAPWCVTLCFGLMLAAGLLAALRFDTLVARLPHFHEFLSATNLVWLAVTLGVTKVLHELGHGIACRHYGGECHEMGLMLLVFTPCLYCNVSDAWMLPRRRHRIIISAAGVYVELLLASVCLFLWWFSVPGPFNAACLNVVIVCSVSTALFNGNPLLRYDGYYILSDLVEIPNLRQQAAALVRNALSLWFCDTELSNRRLLPEKRRTFLVTWFIASTLYRFVVVWGILWFVHSILQPYGLEPLVVILGAATVGGLIAAPIIQLYSLMTNPFWSRTVNWPRFRFRSSVVLVCVSTALLIPLPCSVNAPAVIQADGARSIYVHYPGRIQDSVSPGDTVGKDAVLAQLDNPELNSAVAKLKGELAILETRLDNLQSRRGTEGEAIESLIPTTQKQISEKVDELRQREADQRKLTILAPEAGTVLPPAEVEESTTDATRSGALPTWSGIPLDERNRGAFLETGTELCLIGRPGAFEVIAAIDQSDIEFVETGRPVEILIDHLPDLWLRGTVVDIAEIDLDVAPRELVEHDEFPTRIDSDGVARPVTTAYQARIRFDEGRPDLILRAPARAKITTAPRSLASRTTRFLQQTFSFR